MKRYLMQAWFGAWLLAAGTASGVQTEQWPVSQRYVTSWSVDPVARLTVPVSLEANGARCRLLYDNGIPGEWWIGRVLYHDDAETVFHIPLAGIAPGQYTCQYDLRTPLGAKFIDGMIRVPIVARFTDVPVLMGNNRSPLPISTELVIDASFETWPQRRYGQVAQDGTGFWFAWDMQALYIGAVDGGAPALDVDALPAARPDGVHWRSNMERGWARRVPWSTFHQMAGPHLGQLLRVTIRRTDDAPPENYDLLLVGSGTDMHFGANVVSGPVGTNDQGPDPGLLRAVMDKTGLDLRQAMIFWGDVEPLPPLPLAGSQRTFDFSMIRRQADLYHPGMVYFTIVLEGDWQMRLFDENRDLYYEMARPYLDALTKELHAIGVRYVSCGWNEPGLFHFSDREGMFVRDLSVIAEAVRRNMPGAKIIAGKFCGGNPETITNFARAGFRDIFDVLDIHPYSNDPRTGCHMGEVVASHEALAELGMEHKRIYLGEGWGPTRYTHGVTRMDHDDPVSEMEADLQRQYYWNGYRCLTSPRIDYNPDWVLAAKYFTFNDNVGETYWKVTARPHYNAAGEIDYYLLSHLRFDSLEAMRVHFYNGGLVDFYARPKGKWLFDFPPSLPDVRVSARHDFDYMLRGRDYPITVSITNAEPDPIRNLHVGLRERTALFRNRGGKIAGSAAGPMELGELAPGETWETQVLARVVEGPTGALRLAVEVDFEWGEYSYTEDAIVRTGIRDAISLEVEPDLWVLDAESRRCAATVVVQNNRGEAIRTRLLDRMPAGLTLSGMPERIQIAPGERKRFDMVLSGEGLSGGTYRLATAWDESLGVTVIAPQACPHVHRKPRIDGDLSDWPAKQANRGGIRFGDARMMPPDAPVDPFPTPVPMGESVIGQDGRSDANDRPREAGNAPVDTFAVKAGMMWDDTYLYFGAMIEDDQHTQAHAGPDVWRGDSIQLGIDALGDAGSDRVASYDDYRNARNREGYGPDDYELAMALTPKGPSVAYTRAPTRADRSKLDLARVAVKHEAGFTTYELALPWSAIAPAAPAADRLFRLSVLVNNTDGDDRRTLEWGGGIAAGKYPSRFVPVILTSN